MKKEPFEQLKEDAIKAYTDYISLIKKFSYDDVKHLDNRLELLDAYNKSIASNATYRDFINDHIYKAAV